MTRTPSRSALALLLTLGPFATPACGLPEKVRGLVARPTPTPLPAPTPIPAPPLAMSFLGIREERARGGSGRTGTTVDVELAGTKRGEVESARIVVAKAVDDLGASLVGDGASAAALEAIRGENAAAPVVLSIPLKLASRKAASIREVSGEIELYVPNADPGAAVTIPRFRAQAGKAVASPSFSAHRVVVVLAPAQVAEALPADPDELVLKVTDPDGRIEGFYFVDSEATAWATNREERGGFVVVSAQAETPGPEWGLKVRLRTPGTLRRYRFALRDVPLP